MTWHTYIVKWLPQSLIIVTKNKTYILVGEMVVRKIIPLDFLGTMTEIPEMRPTNGCILVVVALKLALLFLPFWSFFCPY